MTDRVARDIRVALRGFRRSPTFAVTAVLILGVGIGMTVAIWAVFNAVLLRPPPVSDPDRIVIARVLDNGGNELAAGHGDVVEMRQISRTLRAITAYDIRGAINFPMTDGDRPLPLAGAQVDGQFFDVLGVRPVIGRLLHAEDDSLSHVMVLSYDAWQRYFEGDPAVVGRRFRQSTLGVTYTVVGVAPPGIDLPAGADYWVPSPYIMSGLRIVGRLAPHTTPAMARDDYRSIVERQIREQHWQGSFSLVEMKPFNAAVVGSARPVLVALIAAVSLLLAIICINIGNLQLMRAAARSRELAVRRALGATYLDVVRQLVVECVLLGAAGGALGLVVGEGARRALVAAAPSQLPRLDAVRVSGAPFGVAVAVTLVCILLFGILPVLAGARGDAAVQLRLDTRSGRSTRGRRTLRQALVGAQVALALILLAGAGLLGRSLQRLQSLNLGFRADHLSELFVTVPHAKYPDRAHMLALWDGIAPRIDAVAGVTGVAPTIVYPLAGLSYLMAPWQSDQQSVAEVAHSPLISVEIGGPESFRVLGIPILRGRGFLDSDREGSQAVAVVSATVAQRYWPGQDPIGKRIRASTATPQPWLTVVGVVGDTRWRSLRDETPLVYLSFRQLFWQGYVAMRSTTSLAALLPSIRRAVKDVDPDVVVWTARTMDDYLDKPLAEPRMSALIVSTFGLVALFLAAVGLYGVMASAVREQTRDIGVRMALGATSSQVQREVLRRAMVVSVAGAAVGIFGAVAASRVVASLLFEVSPTDPVSLVGACAILLVVAAIGLYGVMASAVREQTR
ncbi:MAG TPA: ADOP family duplicated permease, partial [Gemmatimonadaceae bacterium]|nr:ADOP family duplicated permease [Gemmatimonadaceae bacterium]